MFGKYIPCRGRRRIRRRRRRDAAITKLDAKDIMHDPSAYYRSPACLLACLYDVDGLSIFIHELLACRLERERER